MNDPSRLAVLSPVETVPRQTQKRDFGTLVASSIGNVVAQGAALVRGAFGGAPMLSAAVAGVSSVNGFVSGASGTVAVPQSPRAPMGFGLSGLGFGSTASAPGGLPALQNAVQRLQAGEDLQPGEYLVLQQAMQQESQQYTTLSNILKVRSDSAKAAINNIR